MKSYSVDFEKVVKNYTQYVNEMTNLDEFKSRHQNKMESIKTEMESIVSRANSGLIIDENIQKMNIDRFKELQMEASKIENEFRSKVNEEQNRIMEESFETISKMIGEYAEKAEIDVIFSKSQLVYVKDSLDLTNMILDVMKEREMLYTEEVTPA
jgi:Skp family chaperone for outer membrane proteins